MSNANSDDRLKVTVDQNDRNAAHRAMTQNWPNLDPTSKEHTVLLENLAEFHSILGDESFELRYNLHPPKDRTEKWRKQFMEGQLSEEEMRARLRADAERPIDFEMLTTFCNAYQDNLVHYSGVLQTAVVNPSEAGSSVYQEREKAIDEHIAVLRGKLPLWRENLETVFDFLEELRIASGAGLIKVGQFEGTSAHWLAQLVFTRITEAWRSCTEISERSHHDPRYLYAANAIDLFQESWWQSFPTPQSIGERLREEFILARAALKRMEARPLPLDLQSHETTTTSDNVHLMDNESRELLLVGNMFSLVAAAGYIFRPTPNSDWGIDGEIEFKDSAGRANGRRLYVQLKSGDSHLMRQKNGDEVFTIKNLRHLEYWKQHEYPVMLVIRQSSGLIRWMDVSAYLKKHVNQKKRQIIFQGEQLTIESIRSVAGRWLERHG